MKVRLTQISVDAGKKLFAIGDTVEPSEELGLTAEYLADLVGRGLAAPFVEVAGVVLPETLADALAAYHAAFAASATAIRRVLEAVEMGSPAAAGTALEALMGPAQVALQAELGPRIAALAALAEPEAPQSDTPAAGSPVAAAGEAGSSTPASEGGPVDGRELPEISAGDDAGSAHAPPPQAGAGGDAGASAPAEPEAQPTEAKKPARKGGKGEG